MRRDTIFYQLFLRFPQLLFELLPNAPADASRYTFEAIEVKEISFRTDGVWMPPIPAGTVYFAEAQFQPDEVFYERMNAEISISLWQLARHSSLPQPKTPTNQPYDGQPSVRQRQNHPHLPR
jgi:predicted transposase/invertase (TIGR01784 family)